jgi:hypothetical protein
MASKITYDVYQGNGALYTTKRVLTKAIDLAKTLDQGYVKRGGRVVFSNNPKYDVAHG